MSPHRHDRDVGQTQAMGRTTGSEQCCISETDQARRLAMIPADQAISPGDREAHELMCRRRWAAYWRDRW